MKTKGYKVTDEKYNIELSFKDINDITGLMAYLWAERDCNDNQTKDLFDKFNKIRKEIITKNLN